jgi:uncharacterized protein (TIGR03435 family)
VSNLGGLVKGRFKSKLPARSQGSSEKGLLIMKTSRVFSLFLFGLGLAAAPAGPGFDLAAIKPTAAGTREGMSTQPGGRFSAIGFPLKFFIATANHIPVFQILGADGWMANDRWSIEAKAEDLSEVPVWAPPYLPEVIAVRLRTLLEDRFALKSHREKRDLKTYTLSVSKKGSKLAPGDPAARGPMAAGPGVIQAYSVTMDQFVVYLNRIMDLPVIDQTGLGEKYKFSLKFAPESTRPLAAPGPAEGAAAVTSDPTIFDAMQDQLGLELKRAKEPVEVLVVDSARKPTEN